MENLNNKRIVLLTGNTNGGMVLYMYEIYKALIKLGNKAYIIAPQNIELHLSREEAENLFTFEIKKRWNPVITKLESWNKKNRNVQTIEKIIEKLNPDYLWTTDDKIIVTQVGRFLYKRVLTIMTIHDPVQHPENNNSIIRKINKRAWLWFREKYVRTADYIIFASNYSKNVYVSSNKFVASKTYCLPLGAQIPLEIETRPNELCLFDASIPFFLFFGRIENYKGIDILLKTFHNANVDITLVVAGGGNFTKYQSEIINSDDRIVVINRFINDDEMLWLVHNSRAVILPYIEASQSGVLPIAYYYGKPVITSEAEGLTQFVEDKTTGLICNNDDHYINAYIYYAKEENANKNMMEIKDYYRRNLDWDTNVEKFLSYLQSKN